ncbi:MAG: S1 family peptidase [Candidatus Dojkabacteria bacterium]|nr:S1 family peptidase [Candidatus Dojkabacteria bacterium]
MFAKKFVTSVVLDKLFLLCSTSVVLVGFTLIIKYCINFIVYNAPKTKIYSINKINNQDNLDLIQVGYVLSENIGKSKIVNICSGVLINQNVFITAAHCIEENENVIIGFGQFSLDFNSKIPIINIQKHPAWDKKLDKTNFVNISTDIAKLLTIENISNAKKIDIEAPQISCNYFSIGYGPVKNMEEKNVYERKKFNICIQEIIKPHKIMIVTSTNGNFCYGNSGSPIFSKTTNAIVGIFSSISLDQEICKYSNRGIAVNIYEYKDFVDNLFNYVSN